ncbi:I78 family peptidase inhibitor [Serratia rhizosphaerae]|uniref:I78 family peptidase inhibitor n=1 Tax=unclassified Serratia (in: enterobacteria) TaxID=2647522 RepID=UPI000DA2E5BD|nr:MULTISPECIES: I78 family peptidase inhibitor [unclassified Serratia (in: enterobacteria)]MBU3892232.1 peptidase inhibitor I78 family protein [Serratia rubidaea]MCA4822096.1 peptidase inhibitor I78 family protein [Serratia rubidaea]QNK30601.1 peptidase inhibitor I78 family protein [Serratia sp. JUb9]QPT15529.1 peptidase inhibitor I78 family protein [Serratia rubidaea]CAE1145634.1 Peptidase inhibitor I78 family [Serratia sp. Tan611]
MKFYRKTLMLAALMTLAACSSTSENGASASSVDADDTCGASQYQNYVGKPLSSLDGVQIDARQVRTIPYNSAVTMDFNLTRLNFLGDRDDKITRVYCG